MQLEFNAKAQRRQVTAKPRHRNPNLLIAFGGHQTVVLKSDGKRIGIFSRLGAWASKVILRAKVICKGGRFGAREKSGRGQPQSKTLAR